MDNDSNFFLRGDIPSERDEYSVAGEMAGYLLLFLVCGYGNSRIYSSTSKLTSRRDISGCVMAGLSVLHQPVYVAFVLIVMYFLTPPVIAYGQQSTGDFQYEPAY